MTIIITALVILLMITLSGFLSATETAITASSPGKIQKIVKAKSTVVTKILKTKDKVISTLLIGNTLVNTVCVTVGTGLFIDLVDDPQLGTVISSAVMSFLIIVFAEVIPKAIAVSKAESIAIFTAPAIMFFLKLLTPINMLLDVCIKIFCKIFRIDLRQQISAAEEVRGVIEHHHQEGNVYKADRDMLGGVLDIRTMTISEIMIHRSHVDMVNSELSKEVIVNQALSSPYNRVLLWKEHQDNIIGILHVKDLVKALQKHNNNIQKINILTLIDPPWFVSEDVQVIHQLQEFRAGKTHLACVINEYGEFKGIVTLKDILEEIVGPIRDEYSYNNVNIVKKSEGEFIINGSTTIRDINRELNWNLPYEHVTTIAGLIINQLKRIPDQGETLKIFNLKINILKKLVNKIETVKITIMHPQDIASDQSNR